MTPSSHTMESPAISGRFTQLPEAIKQAHERIIGGRQVVNSDKVLSLYEPDVHVIVRGKAGAEVEFGNTLLLAEQANRNKHTWGADIRKHQSEPIWLLLGPGESVKLVDA